MTTVTITIERTEDGTLTGTVEGKGHKAHPSEVAFGRKVVHLLRDYLDAQPGGVAIKDGPETLFKTVNQDEVRN